MSSYFRNFADVSPCKEYIKIKAGVVHMWRVTSHGGFNEAVVSVEVVFIDQNVCYFTLFNVCYFPCLLSL